jgi:flagellar capping protein FliD
MAMSSGITLSGFNNIDFNQILEALMAQERLPVTLLEAQKASAEKQKTAYATLASRLSSLQSAADTLKSSTAFNGSEAVVSDDTRLKFNAGAVTPEGSYEILISELAHAQTTTSTNTYADRDTTTVADGGTVIGGVSVAITGAVTSTACHRHQQTDDTASSPGRPERLDLLLMLTGDTGATVSPSIRRRSRPAAARPPLPSPTTRPPPTPRLPSTTSRSRAKRTRSTT